MLLFILVLFFVANVKCFNPNCVPENQFKFYRFPVQGCSENFPERCKFHPGGLFKSLGDASLVKIGETEVLPTCAFYKAETLTRIYGANSKIRVLATGAFTDLPNLLGIHMQYNSLGELRKDVFTNVSAEVLDFSWNRIFYIDPLAFSDIRGLKHLNLSRNSLLTMSINTLPKSLDYLNLGYNLLSRVALNSHKFLNLTKVDLSNNQIEKIAVLFNYPLDEIDFTNNRLTDFDFIEIPSIRIFRLGRNQFENVPKYIDSLNAKEIDLYPNPWKCDQLFLLWETLVSFNIRLAPKETGKNPPAECFTMGGNLGLTKARSTPCSEDFDCADYTSCRARNCWDPCENEICHSSSFCETKDHQFSCSCSNNLLSDPLDITGVCQDVECFTNSQCQDGRSCFNNTCIRLHFGHGHGGGHGGFGHGHGHGGGYGGYSDNGSAQAGDGHKVVPGGSTTISGAAYYPNIISEEPAPKLPWWYEDIPQVEPSTPPTPKAALG